ncbi:FAD-dependent oxidoreductase [Paradesulfitobacterium aromaticivorans]
MEIEEIQEVIEYFGLSAANCREAGFDGIELHGGTSYLFHQFLSPLWNKRTDEYGGSLENRMRFAMQVIDKVRSIIGDGMALGYRLTVDDFSPGGLGIEDVKEIAQLIEATGKVDYFNVATGFHGGSIGLTMYEPHCTIIPYCAQLKEAVDLPVVANMRIVHPLEGEKILADGHGDLIAMTRAQIADPELGNKARDGRLDEIRSCTGCLQSCIGNVTKSLPCDCTQNPTMGREKAWGIGTMDQAVTKKRVMVVGGGPAGLEAAWVAAARGHEVTLYEKEQELGGQINLASKLPGRAESDEWVRYRKVMAAKHGVKIVLGKEMTAEDVLKENPDAVVLANGSTPYRNGFQGVTGYPIPGWDSGYTMVVDDVIEGKEVTTDKVVILDEEANVKAPGVAEILAAQGKEVMIVDRHNFIASDVEGTTNGHVLKRLAKAGVKLSPQTFVVSIDKDSVTLIDLLTGSKRVVEGVTVIFNTGRKPNEDLYFALKGKVKELHRIGDCLAARLVGSAIYDGHKVGRQL